ncbi:MAG TPA: flagellar basal body P-ring protein FlgI [bacterium]|nr:flagellar basal body P-ring protein FlgI [bacterium]
MTKKIKLIAATFALVSFGVGFVDAAQVRLKTIATIKGVRENQLIGYGLVVGLQRTGDTQRVLSTLQSITNMLSQFGIVISPSQIRTQNVAAVMVTAQLPALLKSGDKIDVTVSSIGDARSLQGGNLLMTPLQGPDGQVYAVAQGPLAVGGFSDNTGEFPLIQTSQTTVGRVPSGALVEREVPSTFVDNNTISVLLDHPDFGQASLVTQAINQQFGDQVAKAVDGGQIDVKVPFNYQDNVVDFLGAVEDTSVMTDSPANRVVINERTGTVVLGQDVRIDAVAIAHGNLRLVIKKTTQITRDAVFGHDELTHTTTVSAEDTEKQGNLVVLPEGATMMDVVTAINAVGATPRDLISILQAVKAAGALHAELTII